MPVLLVSYPRSGNTMFRITARCAFGVPSFSLMPATDYDFSDELASLMGCGNIRSVDSNQALGFKDSDLFKTHLLPSGLEDVSSLRRIYIVRDGRDCLVSFAHHGLPSDMFQLRLAELALGCIPNAEREQIGTWSEHVLKHLDTDPVICRYEDMKIDPVFHVGKALAAAGIDSAVQTKSLPSFDDLRKMAPQFFRRGKVGSWRDEMRQEVQNKFWKVHGKAMRRMGYE